MNDSGMNEDLWGEDISEEAMEECLLQASQICSQTATNQQATNLVTIAASTSISQCDQFKMPILQTKNVYAFCKQSNSVPPRRFNNMVKKTSKNSLMKSELSQGSNPFGVVSEMAKCFQNFTEHKKRKQVNIEKLMADYERLNRVSLYLNRRSLEPCYASIHSLTVLDSLDCTRSKYHIEKILGEVLVLLSDQLTMLKELDLSGQELQDLDRELLESSDERLMRESMLLSSEQWSSQESGVEARRGLGLLAAITSLSSHAASLLSGQVEYSSVITLSTPVKPNCQPFFVYDEFKVKPKDLSLSYLNCNLGFLTLLRDLCVAIKQERRCLAYSGILAGVVALIKSVMIHPTSQSKCMPLVCQILKEIVFCRPQVNVILPFTELLYILSPYPEVCGSLCHNSPKEKYLDKCSRDIIHFHTEDSCVLQVLSWLVGVRIADMTVRSHVCRNFVRWLSGCFSGPHHGPPWLHGMAGTCICRKRLEQVTCGLLYRAFQDFKQLHTEGSTQTRQTKWFPGGDKGLIRELRSTIQTGILVLHRLVDQDQDFGIHIASMEGEWQMFVLGCGKAQTMLGLNARQRRCLEELVTMEEEEIKPDPGSSGMTPEGVRENETVFHHLWRDHILYMSHKYVQ
uniref:Uncharacterized protein n=1 Tax=Timema cristinae TaxID=61476 RepID=A0A7R9D0P6_TIMCR|nr:unnamed protein product [Timema cristinae]